MLTFKTSRKIGLIIFSFLAANSASALEAGNKSGAPQVAESSARSRLLAQAQTSAEIVDIKENGKREILNHDTARALFDLDRYCKTDWTDPEGHFWLAFALAASGRTGDALHEYDVAEQKQANFGMDCAELRNNRANVLFKMGRIAEAESEYWRAIEIDPTVLDARLNLVQILLLQGRVDDAFRQLGECSNDRKDDPKFCLLEAIANLKKGQTDQSIWWLKKCQVTSNQSQYASRSVEPVAMAGRRLLQYLETPH